VDLMNPTHIQKTFSYETEHVGTCKLQSAVMYSPLLELIHLSHFETYHP